MRGVSAAVRRRRGGGWAARLHRLAWWIFVPAFLVGAVYGTAELSRSPLGQSVLHGISNRLLDATAALGFRVADIRVEGRETTDR
jgi:hypothetical protein